MSIWPFFLDRKSKYLLIILLIILFTIITLSIYFFRSTIDSKQYKQAHEIQRNMLKELEIRANYPPTIERAKENLEILGNRKFSDQQQYEALIGFVNVLGDAYYSSNDPFFRKYISKELNNYAKDFFPDLYSQSVFVVLCADSECGNPQPEEIKDVIEIVNKSSLDTGTKDIIIKNITNMAFIPRQNLDEKEYMTHFIINQLERENNEEASQAASLLKQYFKNSFDLNL